MAFGNNKSFNWEIIDKAKSVLLQKSDASTVPNTHPSRPITDFVGVTVCPWYSKPTARGDNNTTGKQRNLLTICTTHGVLEAPNKGK